METSKLKKFAQFARRSLREQVAAKLKLVLAENSAARRESAQAIEKLEEAIKGHGKDQVIERVAYTWFNRFCALRFMDVNRYNRVKVLSPADPGQFQPEILAEAKMGHIDEEMVHDKIRQQIFALLDGKAPSRDPQGEAYRLLVVAACNSWNVAMPFLFQRIDDYTELLMPDDLLSGNSILAYTREAMTPDICGVGSGKWEVGSEEKTSHSPLSTPHSNAGGVEVIGWLYQFYISEKKDEVFEGLKKNKKITPESIPAATQLFTPHWIVRYLVENSLGRLWMLNRPNSKLVSQMDYYIKPEQPETDFLRIRKPEEIKMCDPACGSGHMLTYAFDLLYAIYEEEGYEPTEIPEKILTHNLFGIEIDERAGELAAFALSMKAAYGNPRSDKSNNHRRFFRNPTQPKICVLKNVRFDEGELKAVGSGEWGVGSGKWGVGSGEWEVGSAKIEALHHDLHLFEEADNFGSLLRPQLPLEDIESLQKTIHSTLSTSHSLFDSMTHQKVLQALQQADYLSPKYHVVIANPPYMGRGGMNGRLKAWCQDTYMIGKSDLFAMFIERSLGLTKKDGLISMIAMQSWMFLSSYEGLRSKLLQQGTIRSMAHLGARAFDSISGEVVSTTGFVIANSVNAGFAGVYLRLVQGNSEKEKEQALLESVVNPDCGWRFTASVYDLLAIPGSPIAYWISRQARDAFSHVPISEMATFRAGLQSGDNDNFLRFWFEVCAQKFKPNCRSREESVESKAKWFPHNKGGGYRKWHGNKEYSINWENDGFDIKERKRKDLEKGRITPNNSKCWNQEFYFLNGLTWSSLSSADFSLRDNGYGFLFDTKGQMLFPKSQRDKDNLLGLLNSKVAYYFLAALAPTLDFNGGVVSKLPLKSPETGFEHIRDLVITATIDWDSYETSWDFTGLPLLNPDNRQPTLKATYQKLRAHWKEMTLEVQRLEEENNRIFIEAYGLKDELTPEVPLNEITLTCNPHYRYGVEKCEVGSEKWEELEARLVQDTMKELVSYAVGCMFGRYSLDMPGLVLANQGEEIEDYYRKLEEFRNNERKELSGIDRLAKSHELGGNDLSGDASISQGGVVRPNESDSPSGSLDSLKHSGGTSAAINSGVQELSFDSTGIPSGSGNPTDDCSTPGLSSTTASGSNPESFRGNQTDDPRSKGEAVLTPHSPLPTSHSPLPTSHSPLPTSHSPLPTSHFLPDWDNVIPMLDGDWFTDDIAERFRKFLRVAFGEEHYEENLRFVEESLNIKGKRNYGIRDYFLSEFYSDHVRRYKKRPIYWLFSSPKGSFNALIYMHRYRPDTVSVVLNDYLREFRTKLSAHRNHLEAVSISASSSSAEKAKAIKEIENLKKVIAELEEYEREVIYPLATEQVPIDLDDGVKVNYPKFGTALKKIPGLEAKEE